jgi:hypothetical protein
VAAEDKAFYDIANNLVRDEAYDYLRKRLDQVERWVQFRESRGEPADLRSLIDQIMQEPNERGSVIVALGAALWRIREMEKANADNK